MPIAHFVFPQNQKSKSKADLIDTYILVFFIDGKNVSVFATHFFASLFPAWYSEDISKYPVTETFCCCSSSHWSNLGCSKTSVIGREAYEGVSLYLLCCDYCFFPCERRLRSLCTDDLRHHDFHPGHWQSFRNISNFPFQFSPNQTTRQGFEL